MTSHNNLHKIRKLTNTIDLKGRYSTIDTHNPSQTVKLPTLNSINRSVKYGDVSFTFSRDLSKLRKQPQAQDYLSQQLAHSSMLTVRRRYDSINRERGQQQGKVKDLQAEKIKYQIEKGKYESQKSSAQNKVKNLQEELRRVKLLVQQSEMQRRVMAKMSSRLKSDKVVYDQRKYNKQLEYDLMTKNKVMLSQQATKMKEETDRVKKVYNKLVNHIAAEQNERDIHVGSMQYMIGTKVDAYEVNKERKHQLRELAQITCSERDEKQKNWYKVYLCQKFIEKLLRDKMDREMMKFNSVEMAFKNVKTSTGVGTVQVLVSKYLKKQEQYGNMLGKIAEQEKKIVVLKTQSDKLSKQFDKLKAQEQALNINKREQTDLSKQQKQFNNINERSSTDYLLQQTIKLWLFKNMKKIRSFGGGDIQKVDMSGGKKEVMDKFKTYLKKIQHQIQELGVIEQKIVDEQQDDLKVAVSGSNLRVNLNPQQKIKISQKNTHNLQQQLLAQNRVQTRSSNNQDNILNDMRDKMHKNNQKFMRQAHRRQQERKWQIIESQPKKKQVVPIKSDSPQMV